MAFDPNRYYRRGLILGLTIAEIVILVVFCLLLAFGVTLYEINQKLQTVRDQHEDKENEIAKLEEKYDYVKEFIDNEKEFDDLFNELVLVRDQKKEIENELEQIKNRVQQLEERDRLIQKMEEIISEFPFDATGITFSPVKKIREIVKIANEVKKLEDKLAKLEQELKEQEKLKSEIEELETKIGSYESDDAWEGKGTEMPSCWTRENSDKPEYIFDVALTSTGLIVHKRNLPHRANELKILPIEMITFDQEISPNQYLSETQALFEWSVEKECRFFVRAFDLTKQNEKIIYKQHLRILEQHFYKYEVLDEPYPLLDTIETKRSDDPVDSNLDNQEENDDDQSF